MTPTTPSTLIIVAHPEDVARHFSTVSAGADIVCVTEDDDTEAMKHLGATLEARSLRCLRPEALVPWCQEQRARRGLQVYTHSPLEEAHRHRDVCATVSRLFETLHVPARGARPTTFTVLDDAAFQRKLDLLNATGARCPDTSIDGLGVEAFCQVKWPDVVRALSLTKPEIFAELADPWGFAQSPYERERYALTARVLETLSKEGQPPRSIIDVGACEGLMTEQLRALFPEATVQAVEPMPEFVTRLYARLGRDERVRIVASSALDLPMEADLVVLAEVLYYLPQRQGRELVGRINARHLLSSYGGPFGEEVEALLRDHGWTPVAEGTLAPRIEPVDGVASPLLVRRSGTTVRLWSRSSPSSDEVGEVRRQR